MNTTGALYQYGALCSGQGGESEDGGRDRAESGGWIDLGKEEKQQLVREAAKKKFLHKKIRSLVEELFCTNIDFSVVGIEDSIAKTIILCDHDHIYQNF